VEGALRDGGRAPGLRLIETLRREGGLCARADRHLARMARGAAALGWEYPEARVAAALVGEPSEGPERLRLTLDRAGGVEVTAAPLAESPGPWRLGRAAERLFSGDPWLGHKTTRRDAYDRARAALPAGLDEVVLVNERGEVCDGTITTLFFDRGAGMRTPPLSSGLLPGVLREEMIATGSCREEVLMAQDLGRVRLWVGNSLRGMIGAVWAG
jgi:4-amino-4-deoxychorismate lyase